MSRNMETGAGGGPGPGNVTSAYRAFLSYSHADSEHADWLHRAIEHYAVPRNLVGRVTTVGAVPKSLRPIFRDRHELAASSDLGQTIRAALKQSRFLIVLCSPAAAASRWVNEEIIAFKKLHGEKRVLAAIVAGEPWTSEIEGRENEECFPPALREKYDSRGRATGKRAEPIAADLREGRDGREAGKLKLVAGMLGLGLDDLVRREQQRRQKRLTYIAAASIAGMTVASGLAVFAFDKRDEARDQRREAEGLVGFMLGDLKEVLEPIGKLDALNAVGARALAYYEQQEKSGLSDAALAQRSRALSLLGQISYATGDTDGALSRYREATRSTALLVERAPADAQRLFDHAQNIFWLGELARGRGRMDQAETAYREYQRLADRMVASDPANPKWQMEALYAKENLGIILFYQRRFSEAAREMAGALPVMQTLAAKDPGNAQYPGELSLLLAWLGDSRRAEGRLDLAITARRAQIRLLQTQLSGGKTDVQLREKLVIAKQALGVLLTDAGQLGRAVEVLQSAIADAEALIAIEPENALWRGSDAGVRLNLATALISLRRQSEAERFVQTACPAVEKLRQSDPKDTTWHSFEIECHMARSQLELTGGKPDEALPFAERALSSARAQRSEDPITDRYRIAAAHRLIGDIHRRSSNPTQAREVWSAGLAQLPFKVSERPGEMQIRAALLRRLGKDLESRALLTRLNTIGYKRTD